MLPYISDKGDMHIIQLLVETNIYEKLDQDGGRQGWPLPWEQARKKNRSRRKEECGGRQMTRLRKEGTSETTEMREGEEERRRQEKIKMVISKSPR